MSRREFTFEAGESRKFWTIERSGSSFTVTFGRIGTTGQSRTKEFATEAECVKAHDKLIAEKIREGYVEKGAKSESSRGKPVATSAKPTPKGASTGEKSGGARAANPEKKGSKSNPAKEFASESRTIRENKTSDSGPTVSDPLLLSFQKQKGRLIAAVEAVCGTVVKSGRRMVKLMLSFTQSTDDAMALFTDQTEIVELALSHNMTDRALVHVARMTNVERLDLEQMKLPGDGLKHLAGMHKLKDLSLSDSEINERTLSNLPVLPALRMINLIGCKVTDSGLKHLARQSSLEAIELWKARVKGPGFAHLAQLPLLQHLALHESELTDEALPYLAELKGLRYLDLSRTAVTDEGLKHLARLKELRELKLRYTSVTDTGLAALAAIPQLESIDLEWTEITDAAIPHLARCTKLKLVTANETWVTQEGVNQFKKMRRGAFISAKSQERRKAQVVALELVERPLARVAASVAESWKRIEAWLESNAPAVRKSLRGPASETDLDRLEETIGLALPDDVRESYLIHDGQSRLDIEEDEYIPGVFFGLFPLPLSYGEGVEWCWKNRISGEPDSYKEISPDTPGNRLSSYPPGAVRLAQLRPAWVPLYWDSGRSCMGIDLDPGPRGISGQVIPFGWALGLGDEERWVLAQSWAHFLEDIADELEAGHAAVESPEVAGENWYYLKGTPKGYLWNSIREWSKAKLPRDFQSGDARVKLRSDALEIVECPTPRTPAPVGASWNRIDCWLEANSPALRKSLRGPARESDLKRVEKTIGQKLPDDVRESYLIHDGQLSQDAANDVPVPGVFFGLRPIPLLGDAGVEICWKEQIASAPQHFDEIPKRESRLKPSSYPADATRAAWIRPGWIPLYWNGEGCILAVDLDPGPRGILGQIFSFGDGLNRWVVAQSWAHFLEDVADELEAGHAAVRSPPTGSNWYYLKGTRRGHLWNNVREWSMAKLPRAFQEGTG